MKKLQAPCPALIWTKLSVTRPVDQSTYTDRYQLRFKHQELSTEYYITPHEGMDEGVHIVQSLYKTHLLYLTSGFVDS